MRIVLDTNVLARATPGPSTAAREVLRLAAAPPHTLLLSTEMIVELSRVLRYDRLRRIHGLTDPQIDRHVRDVEATAVIVPLPVAPLPAAVSSDPDDDPIVATAVIGQANVICSRDRHLRQPSVVAYCRGYAIEIMDDVELLAVLRKQSSSP